MPTDRQGHDPGIVILGGGLAGLTASLYTGAPVYEAEPDWGGASASDRCGGFTFDRGIHLLQTTNMTIVEMLQELGIEWEVIERSAHIYAFGKYTAYPFQINSTNLPIGRRIQCVWSFLRRAMNPEPTNYAEWIYRTIGRGFADTRTGAGHNGYFVCKSHKWRSAGAGTGGTNENYMALETGVGARSRLVMTRSIMP